jgi:hypothetical protein
MKILYLSCHSILEHDEVKMFHELGHEIFSPGAYVEPANPGDASLRPGIPGLVYDPDVMEQFHRIGAAHPGEDAKDHLTKELVDNFDCVIVMHMPRWVQRNWDVMKHKRVIWRTIGQSLSNTEQTLKQYRDHGMEVVRYSPREATTPGFIGQDALIRFYKDPDDYGPWRGDNNRIITFAQSMKSRGPACNFDFFEQVTRPFPRHLFGPGNGGLPWSSDKVPFEQLQEELKANRVYFYTGTHPASYTLNFMEAWMTGIPVVALGPQHGNASYFQGHDLYEVHELIDNHSTGFVSDDAAELQSYIQLLMSNEALARIIGDQGRQAAIRHFSKAVIWPAWQDYLKKGPQP